MVTYRQYIRGNRQVKVFKSATPHLHGAPYKYGTCIQIRTVKPKKPNSAQRKVAKVELCNMRQLIAYIPGFGHNLQKNSEVMIRGGRVPDLPGCHYHIVRGKKDLKTAEAKIRIHRRSKYGVRILLPKSPSRRDQRKSKRREFFKTGYIGLYEPEIWNKLLLRNIHRLSYNYITAIQK